MPPARSINANPNAPNSLKTFLFKTIILPNYYQSFGAETSILEYIGKYISKTEIRFMEERFGYLEA